MRPIRLFTALAAACALSTAAAQSYPTKTVKIIVPFTAGSSTDILGRVVAEHLTKTLGQPFIVENKPGAGGSIGTEMAAKSPPDGYTLIMAGSGPFGVNPALEAKLPYDAVKDFEPIANVGLTPQVFAVGPSAKFRTLKDFVAAAKAAPGTIDYGSLGKGTTSHLAMEYFQSAAGIKLNHIPFKGSSEAHAQVMGGNVTMVSDAVPGILPHIKSGKLTALGIASLSRSPFAPDIPTLGELGYPGFEAVGWIGFAAPAKTPVAILDRLNAEVKRMLADPQVKEKLDKLYFVPVGDSRAEFGAFIKAEIAKWSKVAKDAGMKAD